MSVPPLLSDDGRAEWLIETLIARDFDIPEFRALQVEIGNRWRRDRAERAATVVGRREDCPTCQKMLDAYTASSGQQATPAEEPTETPDASVAALVKIRDWLMSPMLDQWSYMEGPRFYEDKATIIEIINAALASESLRDAAPQPDASVAAIAEEGRAELRAFMREQRASRLALSNAILDICNFAKDSIATQSRDVTDWNDDMHAIVQMCAVAGLRTADEVDEAYAKRWADAGRTEPGAPLTRGVVGDSSLSSPEPAGSNLPKEVDCWTAAEIAAADAEAERRYAKFAFGEQVEALPTARAEPEEMIRNVNSLRVIAGWLRRGAPALGQETMNMSALYIEQAADALAAPLQVEARQAPVADGPMFLLLSGGDGWTMKVVSARDLDDEFIGLHYCPASECPADEREILLADLHDDDNWERGPHRYLNRYEDGYVEVIRLEPDTLATPLPQAPTGDAK